MACTEEGFDERRRKKLPKASSSRLRRGLAVPVLCLSVVSCRAHVSVLPWFDSGYSSCVSLRLLFGYFIHLLRDRGPTSILRRQRSTGLLQLGDDFKKMG